VEEFIASLQFLTVIGSAAHPLKKPCILFLLLRMWKIALFLTFFLEPTRKSDLLCNLPLSSDVIPIARCKFNWRNGAAAEQQFSSSHPYHAVQSSISQQKDGEARERRSSKVATRLLNE
jgi:hypothetical protein